jgi:hypothetical protein
MSEALLVTKSCSWCKREDKAYLMFFTPRGWIRHRTRDEMDMLFCSLACFQEFMGMDLAPKRVEPRKPKSVKEGKQLIAAPAR